MRGPCLLSGPGVDHWPQLTPAPRHTVYENEDQLLWDPNVLPEREVEEFLYRAVQRRWHEVPGSQLPVGETVKDSEQVGRVLGGVNAHCSHLGVV